VPHLELSWPQAAVLAAVLAAVAVVLVGTRRARLAAAGRFTGEAALLVGLFALWQYAGSFGFMSPSGALPRGQWLWHAERWLHLPSETALQKVFLPHPLIIQFANLYYAVLHFPMLLCTLGWLFIWHRDQYRRTRTTVVLFTAAALIIQFIPVAPPRLLSGTGLVDTAVRYGQSVYGVAGGFDQLSAMPSVHVGWSIIVAIAVVTAARSGWRWLAVLYPVLTTLVVVITANHFWLDGVAAGLLVAGAVAVQKAGRSARLALLTRTAGPAAEGAEGTEGPRERVNTLDL
jgi:hypothetical protein